MIRWLLTPFTSLVSLPLRKLIQYLIEILVAFALVSVLATGAWIGISEAFGEDTAAIEIVYVVVALIGLLLAFNPKSWWIPLWLKRGLLVVGIVVGGYAIAALVVNAAA